MTIVARTLAIGLALACCAGAVAEEECTQGSLTRTVTVVYAEPGQPVPCEVLYDKPQEGGAQTLWRARNEAGYCEARARELVDTLERMGWECEPGGTVREPAPNE